MSIGHVEILRALERFKSESSSNDGTRSFGISITPMSSSDVPMLDEMFPVREIEHGRYFV